MLGRIGSYFNPCAEGHVKITEFHKIPGGLRKAVTLIAAIFAAILSVFIGGLGGLAVYRLLANRFVVVSSSDCVADLFPFPKHEDVKSADPVGDARGSGMEEDSLSVPADMPLSVQRSHAFGPIAAMEDRALAECILGSKLTPEGVEWLRSQKDPTQFATYLGCSPEARQEMRRSFFEWFSQSKRVTERPLVLDCITGYAGEKILAAKEGEQIILMGQKSGYSGLKVIWKIVLSSDGAVEFSDDDVTIFQEKDVFPDRKKYCEAVDVSYSWSYRGADGTVQHPHVTYEGENYFRINDYKRWEKNKGAIDAVKFDRNKQTGPAFFELLFHKRAHIKEFLEKGNNGVLAQVIQSCLHVVRHPPAPLAQEDALIIAPDAQESKVVFGPMQSPVNSQDSAFTWTRTVHSDGTSSLEFGKTTTGRAFGAKSDRKLSVASDGEGRLIVTIEKGDSSRMDYDPATELGRKRGTKSVYLLEEMEDGQWSARAAGIERTDEVLELRFDGPKMSVNEEGTWEIISAESAPIGGTGFEVRLRMPVDSLASMSGSPRITGVSLETYRQARMQAPAEIAADLDFACRTLTTVADLASSPHTVFYDTDAECYRNIQGLEMPEAYIHHQQRLHGQEHNYHLGQYLRYVKQQALWNKKQAAQPQIAGGKQPALALTDRA